MAFRKENTKILASTPASQWKTLGQMDVQWSHETGSLERERSLNSLIPFHFYG